MLIEVDSIEYNRFFPVDPHPFISEHFIELNKGKVDRVIRLVNDNDRPVIGFIAGIRNGLLQSPFSAPFGGFHFRNENIYISEIDSFIRLLQTYVISQEIKGIEITLPPDIYHSSFNAKTINSLIRNGFQLHIPDITNWVNLQQFNGTFTQKNSKKYYNQGSRNGLEFSLAYGVRDMKEIYELICHNRANYGRPIFMSFKDILNTGAIWPVDFFKLCTGDGLMVASAIFYRSHPDICYGVFWGDNEIGRPLRSMDYLAYNLWTYYKNLGFKFLDLGIATEFGVPNEGLLRFKESHESTSSLRFRFSWNAH
jgi:hypothetical protein